MSRWFLLGLLSVVACSSPSPRPEAHWRRTSEGAEPLETARRACKAYALDRSSRVVEQLAAKAAAGAFAECMSERGWVLADQE